MSNPWNADKPFNYDGTWVSSRPIIQSMCRKVTGNESKGWQQYVMEKYLYPALTKWDQYTDDFIKSQTYPHAKIKTTEDYRCLILGSNEGTVERILCSWGFVGEIVASDIAEKALARARAQALELGYRNIVHVQADLNTDNFDGKFDFVIAEGVLHHISNVDHCLQTLDGVLPTGGIFIAADYVGPFRFQLPPEQVAWINAVLAILPRGLRPLPAGNSIIPASADEHRAAAYTPPPADQVIRFDPSEAISGHILKSRLTEIFDVIEATPCGGTIVTYLQGLMDYIKTNESPYREWMEIALDIEDTLIRQGALNSDYMFYVAKPKR
jgi:SAM-dependent methyltransferase